ncbi:MAG: dTDP-4-dehydrorhamnose reductase [Bacteroidales bacterium]|nr:dTDP-4-dehydrorhamnose reductase [Bacteroidales bacterium]
MKILITGGDGQLGSAIKAAALNFPTFELTFTDIADFDITNANSVDSYLVKNKFDFLINCAAYTAVDKAEEQQELAYLINETGPKNLAKSCSKSHCKLIHISTDYVFDGKNFLPYTEEMPTNPLSIYGKTKLAGEKAIFENSTNSFIIRTSWLYSEFGNNFLKTMQKYGAERNELRVIFDQIGTPTYAGDLAETILSIIQNDWDFEKSEIFHFSNEGVVSWYDFAKEIMEFSNIDCQITPIESRVYPLPAPRPNYSVLNKSKIKKTFPVSIPYWKDSLKVCISRLSKTS